MKTLRTLADWFDNRTGCRRIVHEAFFEHIPGGARWRYVWGSTLVFTFAVQAITGIFLWMAYSPSAQTAWESVYYIQNEMQGGWLLRGLHHFTAQAMIVLLVLHLMQVIIDGAYRAPREVNFWLGLVLMMIVLGLSLTGYLLPWDQKGYWATRVATNLMGLTDKHLPELAVGGADYGHHTLTRFFAFHAGVLPALLVGFLVLHIALFRRHGIWHKTPVKAPDCTFWPDQVLRDAVACLAVLAVVLYLIARPALPAYLGGSGSAFSPSVLGAELGAPADPAHAYSAARPEWYFLFLFQFLKLFEGWGERGEFLGAIVVPGLVMLVMFLMPIVGRWKLGHRFNIAFAFLLLGGIGWLTASAYIEDHRAKWTDRAQFAEVEKQIEQVGNDEKRIDELFKGDKDKIAEFRRQRVAYEKFKKSEAYLVAVARANEDAERVKELAGGPQRIPPAGALAMLREDSKTQGRILFNANCAACHSFITPDSPDAERQFAKATAANLYGFASRQWLTRFLDAKHIGQPEFWGKTSFVSPGNDDMVKYVTDTLSDSKEWKTDQVKQVIAALSAEAALPGQRELDAKEQEAIKKGQSLLKDSDRCAQCHKFHDADSAAGSAPDLTDYGSKEWLTAFICDPAAERFYGAKNERMPSYAKGRLDSKQIGFLVNWLRGDYDAPAVVGSSAQK
ncbi:MAG TPA: cytochrome b N-terminal domain-containing protein [Pirellulales bacterium]|nr:cytochrome b N-terminal domain-containing protein [Pirellulales bacterium]